MFCFLPYRVRLTLQNEWEWDVETLLFEGENVNEFFWQVQQKNPFFRRTSWRK